MSKTKGIIKSIVTVVLVGGLAVGGYILYKNFDTVKNKVTDWWDDITNHGEQSPTQKGEIKDFTFAGNKITGYKGSEVVLESLPTSYSMNIGEVEESIKVSFEDMSDQEAMQELNEKLEIGSFYCTPNGGERFFSPSYEDWSKYMSEHYPNESQAAAFPLLFEFCSVTYTEGDDYQITEIADDAFAYNTVLSKIVIPENIKSIGQQAFYNCENLTEINIPEGLTEIKYNTFYGCKRLENITLPNSLVQIDHGAFDETAITTLTIPANVSILDVIVSEKSELKELHIQSSLISPDQITSLSASTTKLKIYVPDNYFVENYDSYFNQYLDRIYPENGTYPETPEPEPEPEPEGREVTVYFRSGTTTVSKETYTVFENQNTYVKVPEDPTPQDGKLFCGWKYKNEFYDEYEIQTILINNTDNNLKTVTFTAHFYDEPKPLEEFDLNGEVKDDVQSFTIIPRYYQIRKHINIETFNSKEELLANKSLYVGKRFVCKNERDSYNYYPILDEEWIQIYAEEFKYPLTCSAIETYIYDLVSYSEEEIENFLSRNYFFIELEDGESYIGSEYADYEYKDISFYDKNIRAFNFVEGTVFYDYRFVSLSSLEKIVLNNSTVIPVCDSSVEPGQTFQPSDNLQIPANTKIYVPHSLLESYRNDTTWSKVADQIHPISELDYSEFSRIQVSTETILESLGNIKYSDVFDVTKTNETYTIVSSKGKVKSDVEYNKENGTLTFDYSLGFMSGKMTLNFKDMTFTGTYSGRTTSDVMVLNAVFI